MRYITFKEFYDFGLMAIVEAIKKAAPTSGINYNKVIGKVRSRAFAAPPAFATFAASTALTLWQVLGAQQRRLGSSVYGFVPRTFMHDNLASHLGD